ncbi:RodZ domain-containing protein [Lonepinella sp. MS14437]|uniref:RodZ domain-containing protein n=1 Tax=Lonepinella sp. MS14437 TaxID=3003620 RepID=UPI0036DDE5E4
MDTQINLAEKETVGETFRQARQKLNLTIEQAAEKVNLRPSVIESIENNQFVQKNIPATFMKGYVRNYGEFLKLPVTLWNGINFGGTVHNDLNKQGKVRDVVNPHGSNSRWVGWLTALVLLFVIGMTALWWWESYQQTNLERDNLVQNYVSTEEQNKSIDNSNNIVTTTVQPATEESTLAENSNLDPNQAATVTVGTTDSTAQGVSMQYNMNDNTNSVASFTENNAQNTVDNAMTGDLQIEVTSATSWIAVRDEKRHNLVTQKEYKQGEVITLDGKGPYSLTIGAPSNVKITYKGEDYPLKIDGRVARIKLQ